MFRLLLYLFFGWILYKLIFDFIIPIYRSTKHVRHQMRDMQEHMRNQFQQQQQQQQANTPPPQPKESAKPREKDDYLDFEEIK